MPIPEVCLMLPESSSLRAVVVEQRGHTRRVALSTCPIVALQGILNGRFFFELVLLRFPDTDGLLSHHSLVLSQNHVLVVASERVLLHCVLRATKVHSSFRVVKVRHLTIFVNKN